MENSVDHKLLGCVLIVAAIILGLSFWLGVETAHASTGDKPSPTARDWQRLNICANASIRPEIKPERQEEMAIKCASWGKAVAHIESGNGTSYNSKKYLNGFGIMSWDKNGKRHIKKFKSTAAADREWASIYFDHYSKQSYAQFSHNWTGEIHAEKHYAAFLKKWVPIYTNLYRSMAESK